jgi:hypothetical protein
MNSERSNLWPSFPRKREPRASDVQLPPVHAKGRLWTPAFAGATVRYWNGSLHFRSDTPTELNFVNQDRREREELLVLIGRKYSRRVCDKARTVPGIVEAVLGQASELLVQGIEWVWPRSDSTHGDPVVPIIAIAASLARLRHGNAETDPNVHHRAAASPIRIRLAVVDRRGRTTLRREHRGCQLGQPRAEPQWRQSGRYASQDRLLSDPIILGPICPGRWAACAVRG